MTPTNTTATPRAKSKTSDTYRIVALAVIVVSSIVVAQLAFSLLAGSKGLPGSGGSASLDEADARSTMYSGLSDLAAVGAVDEVAGPAIAASLEANAEAQVRAQQAFDAAYAQAIQALSEALALVQADLVQVPAGYTVGADVSSLVVIGPVQDFAVPELPDVLGEVSTGIGSWQDLLSPLDPRNGPVLPPTGDPTVDGALADLLQNYQLLVDTLNSPELAPVWGPLQGTPVAGLLGNPGAASSAAAPDEEGAAVASGHAGAFLGAAGSTYGQLEVQLEAVLAAYEDLAAAVADIQDQAEDASAAVVPMVNGQVGQRTNALKADAKKLTDDLTATAATHAAALEQVRADTLAALELAGKAQAAALTASLETETANLEAVALDIVSETDTRSAEIEARLAYAVETLVNTGATTGVDVTAEVEQLRTAAADAEERVRSASDRQVAAIEAAVRDLENTTRLAVAEATVSVESAVPEAQARVEAVLAEVDLAKGYALAMTKAYTDTTLEATKAHAAATIDGFQNEAMVLSEDAWQAALDLTSVAGPAMDDGAELLDRVQAQALGEVGRDLDYIEKVVDDYRTVPTPDRSARASHWSTVHGTATTTLSLVLESGDDLYALAAAVQDAALDAKADLLAMG